MKILTIIPARAGSKGIRGKNLVKIGGKSLLELSISAAINSRYNMRVVVSTDGEEIKAEALRCGAEAVMRPLGISGDEASSESALLHVLDELMQRESYMPDILVFLQCTSPLTAAEDIDGTINAMIQAEADSALAVAPFHYFLWRTESDGSWVGINHDKSVRLRRQERNPEFLETGAVYVMKVDGFLKAKHRFFGKTVAYKMPSERCWEIDDPSDLVVAEALHSLKKRTALPFHLDGLVFDFDGVMTDNAVYISENGHESVRCDRSDGYGIEMLRKAQIPMLILSKERNPVVSARAVKLQIPVSQAKDDKLQVLKSWAVDNSLSLEKIVYVGNDINDLECMEQVGCAVAVADSHSVVIQAADIVLTRAGGHGAIRELAELIFADTKLTEF